MPKGFVPKLPRKSPPADPMAEEDMSREMPGRGEEMLGDNSEGNQGPPEGMESEPEGVEETSESPVQEALDYITSNLDDSQQRELLVQLKDHCAMAGKKMPRNTIPRGGEEY